MADLEIAGGKGDDGSEQSAAGRPEARSAGGRLWDEFGRGRRRPSSVRVFGVLPPDKILKFYIAKDAISCIINGFYSATLLKNVMKDCLTPAS